MRMPALRAAAPWLALALFLSLPAWPVPAYWISLLNDIGLLSLVALGLVMLTGVGGLTSFGQAAFVGIGAYTTALLCSRYGLSPWLGLLAGCLLTCAAALLLGLLTLRMSGHYLPLATIAWALSLNALIANTEWLGQYDGLMGLPPITLGGLSLAEPRALFPLIWVCALGAAALLRHLLDSRAGRALRALAGGQALPEAMGVNTLGYKLGLFLIAALLASVSGWLFAHQQRTVNPSPFALKMGIEYLFMAVLGGVGSLGGAFAGAALIRLIEDQLKDHLPALLGGSGNYEAVVLGLLMVLVLQKSPQGAWPWLTRLWRRGPGAALPVVTPDGPSTSPRTEIGRVLLEAEGLRKQFGGLVAVQDLSLRVCAGEILGLIGPNGAGKSTSFNLLSGLLAPDRGVLRWLGQDIVHLGARARAQAGLSRSFQHVKLVPGMSVLDNVALGGHRLGRAGLLRGLLRLDRTEEARLRASALRQLARVGLAAHAHQAAGSLALGQQRLVEIARALCSEPLLLLLDEPAAGLRHQEKLALAQLLIQLRSEGLGLVLVEHDMGFLMELADRLLVMEFGALLLEGTPQEVQQSPLVRAAYLGTEH